MYISRKNQLLLIICWMSVGFSEAKAQSIQPIYQFEEISEEKKLQPDQLPWKSVISPKFSRNCYHGWVKFSYLSSETKVLYLEVKNHFIDSLQVWGLEKNTLAENYHTSYTELSHIARPVSHHYFIFPLTFHAGIEKTILLKGNVFKPEILKMPLELWQLNDFLIHHQSDTLTWAAFMGMMGMAILLSLANYVFHPRPIYLYYAGYVFLISSYTFINDGLGVYLPESLSFLDNAVLVAHWLNLSLGFFILFCKEFLSVSSLTSPWWLKINPLWLMLLIEVIAIGTTLISAAGFLWFFEWGFRMAYVLAFGYMMFFVSYMRDAYRRKFRPMWLLLASVAMTLVFYSFNVSNNEGLLHIGMEDMLLLRLALVLEIIIISVGWVYRQKLNRDESQRFQLQTQTQQLSLLEAQKHQQTEEMKALRLQHELIRQREQLARDLHDGIGSHLTHISSRLDVMSHRHTSSQQLVTLSNFTRETNQLLRETIWVLHQDEITFEDYRKRWLGWLRHLWEDRTLPELKVAFEGEENFVISPPLALTLLRIGQEAVNNVLKYAQAKVLTIDLSVDEISFRLKIQDDGVGFDKQATTQGYGLQNMKQRTEELSGSFLINSSPIGTIISVFIPNLPKNT
jgi:signal transduction histidine kinase